MEPRHQEEISCFMEGLIKRNPDQAEFHQAVYEVARSIVPYISDIPHYREAQILERLTEPDRVIMFRVCWQDDDNKIRTNRGYRVQHNNAIGPYKGCLRFTHEVSLSVLKFLAFEQTFKNSLTGLPMGGAKGGADFNPKGKSNDEVMRFCQSFMSQLWHHIGANTDVPAGDIGVGAREISYLFGQHKRLTNEFTGVLTGKGLEFGGSLIRTEATGYGAVYFLQEMLKQHQVDLEGKTALVSGSGNVGQHAIEKLIQNGAKVVTASDSSGFIHDSEGFNEEKLAYLKDLKNVKRGRIEEYANEFGADFYKGQRPWRVPCQIAMPCATQNELTEEDAKTLIANGCVAVCEGANMPTEQAGVDLFLENNILFAPAKAANAGGVAVSGLEMTQNSMRLSWSREELDLRLHEIMQGIHEKCVQYGSGGEKIDYVQGANIGGFIKVADAIISYGVM
jgi:glutamate dehydrogenase (NADP+)